MAADSDRGEGDLEIEIGPASPVEEGGAGDDGRPALEASGSGKRLDQSPPGVVRRPGLVMSNSAKRLDQSPAASPSPSRPVLVMSHSSNRLDQSPARPVLVMSRSSNRLDQSPASSPASSRGSVLVMSGSSNRLDSSQPSPSPSPSPTAAAAAAPVLVLSNSGKRMDQAGRKKYVKQVTGRHNDTELHLAAQRGDLEAVRQIIAEINAQMTGTGEEFDTEVAEIRAAVVNEPNEVEETALLIAAERGFLDIVVELLKHSDKESLTRKNKSGFDALHVAAKEGHRDIVKVLLDHDPSLGKTFGQSNVTPLITAAIRGHIEVVNLLLERVSGLVEISKGNGKNALHFAARQGHVEIVKALLDADPQLARRTDKKGQTALHMAVKGTSAGVVRALVNADPAIVMLPDRNGNLALHVATRKKRSEIVNELLLLPDMNVNALTRDRKTAFDIAEGLPLSEESAEIKDCLSRAGAVRANDLNQPRDELRKTVTEIKKDVHTQLEQARKTNKNVSGIAKELRKLHREGINNATNSVTVVAVLFATVAFAAIFTVPGGNDNNGVAIAVHAVSFKVFFIFNAIALFTSLAVVVVQITLVRGETKAERRVVGVINKLMWLASVCTTVAFISSAYIVVGRHFQWAALLVTLVGGMIMAGVLGTMTYYVVRSKRTRSIRKKVKSTRRSGSNSWQQNSDFSDSEIDRIYAI
ncbi:ankyrin repeat-containing protein ITN1 [Oryza brachyantha]|uniref:ankyrin repeat-containing protein ITN1 n=1 Tax=Oryza brachyantha TaxID=4533 RepID=UPI001ADBC400|nr:ankyrin repeat-containing protein ITN1 [Oryza brachyantha]